MIALDYLGDIAAKLKGFQLRTAETPLPLLTMDEVSWNVRDSISKLTILGHLRFECGGGQAPRGSLLHHPVFLGQLGQGGLDVQREDLLLAPR